MNDETLKKLARIDEATTMIGRDEAAVQIAERLTVHDCWLLIAGPYRVHELMAHIPDALADLGTFYLDIGLAQVMHIHRTCIATEMIAAYSLHAPVTGIVQLSKEEVTKEAVERVFGRPWTGDATGIFSDVALIRDRPEVVDWPTLLIDAVMLADPHVGQEVLGACAEYNKDHPGEQL